MFFLAVVAACLLWSAAFTAAAARIRPGWIRWIISAAAEGRMLRVEAAQIMAAALPPAPAPDDDAAPLYQRAFASLAADETLREERSPAEDPLAVDPAAPEVAAILDRHAAALDLLRRATDRPGCRFDRDWSRPSIDMLIPEVQEMRQAARLLALAARKAAADGDGARAIADLVRIHRLGLHAASEPILVSGLVGQAIDALALQALVPILPRLGKDDLPLLDADSFRDFLETPITYRRAFLGEEAFGLATFADLSDVATGMTTLELLRSVSDVPTRLSFDGPFACLYRCFLLPADIAGYRSIMSRYQAMTAALVRPTPKAATTIAKEAVEIEEELTSRPPGFFSALMAPAFSGVLKAQTRGEALHDVAGVLVAATRARLMGKPATDSLVPDALPELPRDPFTADRPLLAKHSDAGWAVYSVGPDGEDDGGPQPDGTEPVEGNDDVGLWLGVAR